MVLISAKRVNSQTAMLANLLLALFSGVTDMITGWAFSPLSRACRECVQCVCVCVCVECMGWGIHVCI